MDFTIPIIIIQIRMNYVFSKILGIFTVKIKITSDMHLILMKNILDSDKHGFPNKLYDLKGSLINRY